MVSGPYSVALSSPQSHRVHQPLRSTSNRGADVRPNFYRRDGLLVRWSTRFDDPIPVLVEGHADPLLLAPDDVTGNARVVRLKDKVETLGDVVGISNLDRRPRNGNVAD
jgi:hypothetical protein